VKAATIIFAELTLAVAIVFIVLLLVRVYGWSASVHQVGLAMGASPVAGPHRACAADRWLETGRGGFRSGRPFTLS
jgi:hypothetical protein